MTVCFCFFSLGGVQCSPGTQGVAAGAAEHVTQTGAGNTQVASGTGI